jgi:hypothetical protein
MSASEQIAASRRKTRGLGKKTIELRDGLMQIIHGYDWPLTVRQVYYQAEVHGIIGKTAGEYDRVQRQLLAMRRDGTLPYEAIADNTRWMRKPDTWRNLYHCMAHAQKFYRQSVWGGLNQYVEIWLEKDALAGVLMKETERFDIPLMVTRGYSSESFAYEAAEVMKERIAEGKEVFVYYLGDFDPSGWHAGEELKRKLVHFLGGRVSFSKLGLHPDQIWELDLPTRRTKRHDTRLQMFEQAFRPGVESCELDAIPPNVLRKIVRDTIEMHLPEGWMERISREEDAARETLDLIYRQLPEIHQEARP